MGSLWLQEILIRSFTIPRVPGVTVEIARCLTQGASPRIEDEHNPRRRFEFLLAYRRLPHEGRRIRECLTSPRPWHASGARLQTIPRCLGQGQSCQSPGLSHSGRQDRSSRALTWELVGYMVFN
jgi:hypothetical protein